MPEPTNKQEKAKTAAAASPDKQALKRQNQELLARLRAAERNCVYLVLDLLKA